LELAFARLTISVPANSTFVKGEQQTKMRTHVFIFSMAQFARPFPLRVAILLSLAYSGLAQTGPIITQQPTNQSELVGGSVTFSVAVSGTGPFSYQWQFNGTNLPNFITTVAGTGADRYSGDGGVATNASLYWPSDVKVDAFGNLLIADYYNNRVRKVDTNGIITTVAGTGARGYSGDGVAASNASVYLPTGVFVDTSGNLFIADYGNNRVRKVDTNGIISTVAGNGVAGSSGDGVAATNAELNGPWGVLVDASGNVFFSDCNNQLIREVETNGMIHSIAGNGLEGYSGDGEAATNASLSYPSGITLDASGNLLIADYGNNRIRKVDSNGVITTTVGGGTQGLGDGGPATNASLNNPSGVALDGSGNLFIADTDNNRIREVQANGLITTVAGTGGAGYSGDGGAATDASLLGPCGVAADNSGNLFVADTVNNRMRKVFAVRTPTLTFYNLNGQDVGSYSVVVSNAYGSVTSSVAVLTFVYVPGITAQPQSETVEIGTLAEFSVTADGTPPFEYQWLFDGAALSGQTNSTLTIVPASAANSGSYQVVVSNLYGSVASSVATLIVRSQNYFVPVWKLTAAPISGWTSVASSGDGTTLAACSYDGIIYTSTNAGATWISNNVPSVYWESIAVSPDGTVLAAASSSGGCYISTNAGAIWQLNPDAREGSPVFSADGTRLVVMGTGLFTSTNSGATWTSNNNISGGDISLSGDGTKMLIVTGGDANELYISTNSGASWFFSFTYSDNSFINTTSSADGSKLIASYRSAGIFCSTNSGATWSLSNPKFSSWTVASSVDASRLMAAGSCLGSEEGIYTSTDFGITWISNNVSQGCWQQVACSQDATRLVGIANNEIYTAQWPPFLSTQPTVGSLVFSWLGPSSVYVLQQNVDLTTTNWVTVPITPITTNYQNQVTLPASSNAMFFRLAAPAF
jgi:sugar lactone lactonase YvrE